MNHLAHLFLSRSSEPLMVGNFIADAVKGKQFDGYEAGVVQGILMHREIDTFTDSHLIVSHSKSLLRARYGLYASVLIDLFYDYFLAKNFSAYSPVPLAGFAQHCYRVLQQHLDEMPLRYRQIFQYMQQENWLLGYSQIEGIERTLIGLRRRIKKQPGIEQAADALREHEATLGNDFKAYFPLLEAHMQRFVR